jgi:putative thioredoxin
MGAKSPSELKEFVQKIADQAGDDKGDLSEAIAVADEMLAAKEYIDAAETFAAILDEDPKSAIAFVGLFNAQTGAGKVTEANEMLENIPANLVNSPEVIALRAQLELSQQAAGLGETSDLRSLLENNEDNHQARYDLALALFTAGDPKEAIQELLTIFRKDREWNEDAARKQLFKFFDSLGGEDPITLTGRRQLASMLFA